MVVGVDFTPEAVTRASERAAALGLTNVRIAKSDALPFVREQPRDSFDAAVMTEVAFFLPSYREVLRELNRVVVPGGRVIVAFWSQLGRVLLFVKDRMWGSARMAATQREGHL